MLAITAAPLAVAADYPPSSEVAGEVSPSRIRAGECAVFSGRGFSPFVTITVTDNGDAAGSSRTNVQGEFEKQMCYGVDAKPGKHVLRGTGDAPDGTAPSAFRSFFAAQAASAAVRRTVTATLFVTGSGNQGGTTGGGQVDANQGGTSGGATSGGATSGGATSGGTTSGSSGGTTGAVQGGDSGGAVVLPRTDDDVDAVVDRGFGLPRTGFPALLAAAAGTGLLALGGFLLVVTEHRHRRRRPLA